MISMMSGKLPFRIRELHEQYGEVVRVGPDELSFINPAAWKDIHGIRPSNRTFERPEKWRGDFPISKAENLITAGEDDHNRMRRILKPAFSDKALKEQEPLIQEYVSIFVSKMKKNIPEGQAWAEVDMVQWYGYTTFDIIGHLCFGESFNCLNSGRLHPWLGISLQFRAALFDVALKYYPMIRLAVQVSMPKSAMKPLYHLLEMTHDKLKRRLNSPTKHIDFLTHISKENELQGSSGLTSEEMELNMMLVAVAGSDTLTTALSGATNYLLANPNAYKVAVHEIRSAFPTEKEMTADEIARKLPYLTAVIQETFRMCPPSADGARRSVPVGGDKVCGHWIPAGVSIPGHVSSKKNDYL